MHRDDTTSAPRETAYVWDIASDHIEWQQDAASVLGIADLTVIATGEAFAARILSKCQAAWRSAVLGARTSADTSHGIPYRIQFALLSDTSLLDPHVWLEDRGRWWPGSDGRPKRAHGVLRRIDAVYLENRHLLDLVPGDEPREHLNRARLLEAIGAHVQHGGRTGRPASLLMLSVNGLDAINSRLGPDVGDELITAVGRLIKSHLSETDAIVRCASNTFAVVLHDCGTDRISSAAEHLISCVEGATIETSPGPLKTSVAVGATVLPDHVDGVAHAIVKARHALEDAKRSPRIEPVVSSGEPDATTSRGAALSSDVMSAIADNRVLLALQPIVDARTGQAILYEGLLRIRRPDGTLVAAADFIEEAEQLGLAKILDRRGLELALSLLATHPALKLCLNVSSLTAGDKHWLQTLTSSVTDRADIAPRLTVEITETAMVHDLDGIRAFVDRLHRLGCRVAIDDFGTGYTSFRHLKTLPVDMLKLDGSFMKDLPNDHQGRVIVSSMLEMARALGMETVAEWVTDQDTAEFLANAGATYLQGYLYACPLLAEELAQDGKL